MFNLLSYGVLINEIFFRIGINDCNVLGIGVAVNTEL